MTYQESGVFFIPTNTSKRDALSITDRLTDWIAAIVDRSQKRQRVSRRHGAVNKRVLRDIGMSTLQYRYGVHNRNHFE